MINCIRPDDPRVRKIRKNFSEDRMSKTKKIINTGLLKGEDSFNTAFRNLPCSVDELKEVSRQYNEAGWNSKVVEDNYQTYTIIFKTKEK